MHSRYPLYKLSYIPGRMASECFFLYLHARKLNLSNTIPLCPILRQQASLPGSPLFPLDHHGILERRKEDNPRDGIAMKEGCSPED